MRLWRRGRNPLSGTGSALYHRWMPDSNIERLRRSPAVPLTFTIARDGGYWHICGWYHGNTVVEALHPVLVCERYLPHDRAPMDASWEVLYREVALAFEDLAVGDGLVGERS